MVTLTSCAAPRLDQDLLEGQIKDWAEKLVEDWSGDQVTVTVDCPDGARAETGYTFICELDDGVDPASVRVTVLNENGDVEWELRGR